MPSAPSSHFCYGFQSVVLTRSSVSFFHSRVGSHLCYAFRSIVLTRSSASFFYSRSNSFFLSGELENLLCG
ncbi:hypothetical protein U1Q18_002989 [Sarracenia purpurea var. burkii]